MKITEAESGCLKQTNVLEGYKRAHGTEGEAKNPLYQSLREAVGIHVAGIIQFPLAIATRVRDLEPFSVFASHVSTLKFQVKSIWDT